MQPESLERNQSRQLLDVLIRAGLIAFLVITCYEVFRPFLSLMLWGLILGVTFYPLHCQLRNRLGQRDGVVATLIVVVALALLIVPVYFLGVSMAQSAHHGLELVKEGDWHIPPPNESVLGWPLIGQPLFNFWQQASVDLTSLLKTLVPHLQGVGLNVLGTVAGVGAGFFLFLAALMLAGVFMAYGENGERSAVQIASRISGPDRGPQIARLCTATIRAVAQGVVGIAFIQMLLVGVGFVVMGIPGAGLLALLVLLLGIMQLPVVLITLPVIGYVFATDGASAATIVFAIYSFVAGMSDNILKPLLLGRGVAVPMPVVLIGALGGMVTGGIIGLFVGPVMLAVGYMLFWQWVEQGAANAPTETEREQGAEES
ncbi:MAG: AI-2E family transporter [Pseudomonas sp.]|uniref:AI-2E family transporter n=1 Tax=Pseudomonas sp. TaxID=306 RepID=UPI003D0ADCED